VGIRPDTLTADDAILFSHDVVETLEHDFEWALGVECSMPGGALPSLATLGSDMRIAEVEALPTQLFDVPAQVVDAFRGGCRGLRVTAVTPLCFAHGWPPDGFERRDGGYRGTLPGIDPVLTLRAAMVARPTHVSGWDVVARAPKPTARMVAPGAVYFFERADGEAFGAAEARALWLASLGYRTEEGFGRVAPGIWNPQRRPE
jgi:CRISPR-associated protein Cmr3